MIEWEMKYPGATIEMLGYIPTFVHELNPRSAAEQFDAAYREFGGWKPFPGFVMLPDGSIKYPGDPPLPILAEAKLRDEIIRFYPGAWVAVIQSDGKYEICRLD